ncbi:MAG: bifunctional diaminohydroxyphosphoribosylaminopyrimidine deaminase/5-amino-6-(5-phosphoribosylamino)uracil reductase RibD [Nitrospiraceae bacterium]|nr:bifunctional diaminohydroxyphosphoribosylaminopyrimidine deaminase/5-amino-6-(5-phosphoribosylamino)uracil reductase RibD [Nitrospiraceae bacterium]
MVSCNAMTDASLIRRTLSIAGRARGRTSPNPLVGAVLVKNGRIIAEGYHKKAGTPHAEVIAIDRAGGKARGSTLYVSLEPCCHKDKRTPPCTRKIIDAGIRRVVIAMKDPNPKVSGRGVEELEQAGIRVVWGILEQKAMQLNEHYIKHITTGMPFVILKVAMTLDGKIATPEGESRWITGEAARKMVHRLRGSVDAILTAVGTVRADDPSLTCRAAGGRDPLRVVIDPHLETGTSARVFSTPPQTIVVTKASAGAEVKRRELAERGVRTLAYEGDRVDMSWLMRQLGKMGVTSVMVEGGAALNASCLEGGIVDKVMFFIAPMIIGGRESIPAVGGKNFLRLAEALRLQDAKLKKVGEDFLIEGYLAKPAP